MIKIASGYSDKGGSTSALIDLTNELNNRGYQTTFYGPHNWHLDKCNSDMLNNISINKEDILISHFLKLTNRPDAKKIILHCHEKWWFKVGEIIQYWDEAIFLHDEHRQYHHDYKGSFSIIPNLKSNLITIEKPELDLIAGVIGSIEDRKQTHISIQRALADGCTSVKIFGNISDQSYYIQHVLPLLSDNVVLIGFIDDKQEMYNNIGRVYHSSKGEVACLVKDECFLTNTKFFGNEETQNNVSELNNDEIIAKWVKVFEL